MTLVRMAPRLFYRPDIDGLRAVAVLSVLLYHYGATWLPGGFTGVDIFFVISGYLITAILRREIETGDFSLVRFYDRRIRRIFPTLLVVTVSTIVVGWFVLMPDDYADLGASAAFAAAGLSNLYYYTNTGYFDQASEMQPLLHTWSLGVEEQFYLFWPVVLLTGLSFIKYRSSFIAFFSASLLFAFLLAVREVETNPKGAFYLPHLRAWELAAGALIAFMPIVLSRKLSQAMALMGAFLIGWSLLRITSTDLFPGLSAVYACLGAAFLIWPKQPTIVSHVLAAKPLVAIGLISYSLYLWHWPALVLLRHYLGGAELNPTHAAMLGCMSVGLAYLSWRFVELRFRRPFSVPWKVILIGICSSGMVALAGVTLLETNGALQRFPLHVQQILAMRTDDFLTDARFPECWVENDAPPDAFASECAESSGTESTTVVAVWGDSHAARLYPGLRNVLPQTISLTQFTRNACPPISNSVRATCKAGNEAIIRAFSSNPPDILVMFGAWPNYGNWSKGSMLMEQLTNTISTIKAAGIQSIVLIGPTPTFRPSLPHLLFNYWKETGALPDRLPADPDGSLRLVDQTLHAVADAAQIFYFSPMQFLCNPSGCRTHTENSSADIVTWDYGHLTTSGAEMLASELWEELQLRTFDQPKEHSATPTHPG